MVSIPLAILLALLLAVLGGWLAHAYTDRPDDPGARSRNIAQGAIIGAIVGGLGGYFAPTA